MVKSLKRIFGCVFFMGVVKKKVPFICACQKLLVPLQPIWVVANFATT